MITMDVMEAKSTELLIMLEPMEYVQRAITYTSAMLEEAPYLESNYLAVSIQNSSILGLATILINPLEHLLIGFHYE